MKTLLLALTVWLLVSTPCLGQTEKMAEKEPPKTKFEAFTAEAGTLRVKEVYDLPRLSTRSGKAESSLVRVTNAQTGTSMIALVVRYNDGDRYSTSHSEILDEDEIGSLATALKYMRENRARLIADAKTYTEVTYVSRGGFQAGFYISGTETADYMQIGLDTAFLTSMDNLERVVKAAQDKLTELNSSSPAAAK